MQIQLVLQQRCQHFPYFGYASLGHRSIDLKSSTLFKQLRIFGFSCILSTFLHSIPAMSDPISSFGRFVSCSSSATSSASSRTSQGFLATLAVVTGFYVLASLDSFPWTPPSSPWFLPSIKVPPLQHLIRNVT